jgi:hypothetical protein
LEVGLLPGDPGTWLSGKPGVAAERGMRYNSSTSTKDNGPKGAVKFKISTPGVEFVNDINKQSLNETKTAAADTADSGDHGHYSGSACSDPADNPGHCPRELLRRRFLMGPYGDWVGKQKIWTDENLKKAGDATRAVD